MADVGSGENNLVVWIGSRESLRHPMRSALSLDETTVSGFAKIVEFRSHFGVVFFNVCGPLAACFWSPFDSSSQCSRCETSLEGISLAESQVLAFREAHCSWNSDGCFKYWMLVR